MKKFSRILVVSFSVVILSFAGVKNNLFAEVAPSILILHSYSPDYRWTQNITSGLEAVLTNYSETALNVHYDFLDTKTYYSDDYLDLMYRALKIKYSNKHYDVVIACDDTAFLFVKNHYNDLFPGSSIVFCGVNYYEPSYIEGLPEVTGVVEKFDVSDTLELALSLHPGTKTVFVVNDRTPAGIANLKNFDLSAPQFESRVNIEYSDYRLPIESILSQVSSYATNSIIFMMSLLEDGTGRTFTLEESTRMIRENVRAPLYGVWDFYLGAGIIGGKLMTGYLQGKTAAELAIRILEGEKASGIPVITQSPTQFMFDYIYLKQWNIPLSKLPEGSVIINRPDNRAVFIIPLAAILLIAILLTILLLRSRYLHKTTQNAYFDSETRYRQLAEASFEGIIIHRNGLILNANTRMSELTGYSMKELIGSSIFDVIAPEYQDLARHKSDERNDAPYAIEIIRKDTNRIWIEVCGKRVTLQGKEARIVALHDISQLKRSEESMKRWFVFEKTVSTILSHFVEVVDIDKTIRSSLTDLGKFTGADRVYVFLYSPDGVTMDNTHEWCAEGIEPQIDNLKNIPRNDLKWLSKQMEFGESLEIEDVSALPQDAAVEKQSLEAQGIKSLVLIPLRIKQQPIGFVGLDNTRSTGKFPDESLALLRLFGELLSKILARKNQ